MKTIYDAMTEAIDGIDEKYLIKTAKCFHLPKEDAKRDITINAEDLVEMKKQIKKSNLVAKIAGIAAAFICVMTVAILLVVNNNKVQVLGSSGENSVVSDPFTEGKDEEPQISPEKKNVMNRINSLLLTTNTPSVKFENENKENPAYIDYNGGKIRFSLTINKKLNSKELPDAISEGWYITVNGILQNITVNGEEQGEIYIHRQVKDVDYLLNNASYILDFEFEPVIAEADKDKKQLELSLVQISNPDFKVDPIYPSCANLHANVVLSTRILNVNTELQIKDTKKSEIQYTEELITIDVMNKHPEIGLNINSGFKAEIIDENNSDRQIRADEKGEIKLGAVISGNGEEKLRLLFLVNGIPTKLYDGSDYIEINARTGYLYEIKPDKILDVKPYDSIDILIMYCLDESEKTHMSFSAFPSVILPYTNEK